MCRIDSQSFILKFPILFLNFYLNFWFGRVCHDSFELKLGKISGFRGNLLEISNFLVAQCDFSDI